MTRALWITLSAYILFLIVKWIYIKFYKTEEDPFFYFLSLLKNEDGDCYIRVSAPNDEYELDISIYENDSLVSTKNAHLKMGINKIFLSTSPDKVKQGKIKIQSTSQLIERDFIEAEN